MRSSARFRTSRSSESYGLTEGGSPLRAPIDGRPVPRGSPGVPAPGHRAQADRRAGQRRRGGRAADPMPLCLPRLLQRAGDHPRQAHGWMAAHRRHLLQGQGRLLLFPQPRRRHVQLRRRERLSQGGREPPVRPSRCGECRGGTGAASGEGLRAGRDGDRARGLNRHGRAISRPIAWTRGRPIRIRALSTSSRRCRSTAPARSTATWCRRSSARAYRATSEAHEQ